MKDAGKFAFSVQPEDIVFTIDDDIFYPSDYVRKTLEYTRKLPLDVNSIGYQANALVVKKDNDAPTWKNYFFHKKCGNIFKTDILGTGTACLLGCNYPSLDDISYSSGFVDIGVSLDQTRKGIHLWTIPREDKYLRSILPKDLEASTLFNTVNRAKSPLMMSHLRKLISERTPRSGTRWDKLFSSETGTVDLEK
ncbi:hypothetical protein [Fuscovulum blasticum]|uniref:hypothetical protein n=1 Tax=Fuscovulum blasticum TaxID=1075 RepID=UPI0013DFD1CA|nr:hypothetical protein [Fuscovulum blasticum]